MTNKIDSPTARVAALEAKRQLPRDLMGGTETMRAAKTRYMPQHPEEDDGDYKARLNQTILYGGFSKTVKSEVAKIFMKPVAPKEDVPPDIEEILEDVDGEGRDLNSFMTNVAREAFVDGVSYILVDAPKMGEGSTQADAKAMGWSPYWVHIKACHVLGWKSTRIGKERALSQFRYYECVTEDAADGYGEEEIDQIRVLKRGDETTGNKSTYEIWRKQQTDTGTQWYIFEQGQMSWPEILVVPVYTNRTGFFEGEPPLRELAELNQEHWASSGEQRHALTFLRFAMLMVTGIDDPKKTQIVIGANQTLKLPKGCDAKYIEHTGKGIEAGEQDLVHIEKRMESANMELRVENAGQTTATAAAIDSQDSNAGLKAVAEGIQDSINLALQYTAYILGSRDSGGTVDVYTGFAEDIGSADTGQLTNLYMQGVISRQTLWSELVRRRILSEDFDAEEEQKLLDAEALTMPTMQGDPMQLNNNPNKSNPEPTTKEPTTVDA